MAYQGKKRERNFENVKDFWNKEGINRGDSYDACIRDNEFRKLEIGSVIKYITEDDEVLDIGCGNGYCTRSYAKKAKKVIGVDYSEELIKKSKGNIKGLEEKLGKNLNFEVASVINLPYDNSSFDIVIAQRLLVNLPDVALQKRAVEEIYRVIKPDGIYIFSEATFQGHDSLNEIRNKFGLEDMEKHWHNLYVDEEDFIPFLEDHFKIIEKKRFGTYHFLSKVVHPLIVQPEEPQFDSKINFIAAQIEKNMPYVKELEKASHHLFMVLKK